MLIYAMGKDAEKVFKSFKLSDDDAKKYKIVKEHFEKYFVDRHHVLYEICRRRKMRQEVDESVEAFVARLYEMSEHCGYEDRRETEILHQLLIGMRDEKASQKLQVEKDLTLDKALAIV